MFGLALSCGPAGLAPADTGAPGQDDLVAAPDALEASTPVQRAQMFDEARSRSALQAQAQLFDGPVVFPIEREGHLVAAPLPTAGELLAGAPDAVDLDGSADPWPTDPREALGGASERDLAARVAAALASSAGLAGRPQVERDLEAPYAAAVVEGQIRLNPALLYLAAASEAPLAPAPAGERSVAATSCSAGPGLFPALALAALAVLGRRARR